MKKQKYEFPGGEVPSDFYEDIYVPGANSLRIVRSSNVNWGDDHEIVVSGESQDEIDYILEAWGKYKK